MEALDLVIHIQDREPTCVARALRKPAMLSSSSAPNSPPLVITSLAQLRRYLTSPRSDTDRVKEVSHPTYGAMYAQVRLGIDRWSNTLSIFNGIVSDKVAFADSVSLHCLCTETESTSAVVRGS